MNADEREWELWDEPSLNGGAMRASGIKPMTYMKTHSAELLASVNKKKTPVFITQNGTPRAVLMDVQSYERIQDSLILLKLIAQSEEDFQKGHWLTQEQMERELHQRLRPAIGR